MDDIINDIKLIKQGANMYATISLNCQLSISVDTHTYDRLYAHK